MKPNQDPEEDARNFVATLKAEAKSMSWWQILRILLWALARWAQAQAMRDRAKDLMDQAVRDAATAPKDERRQP